MKLELWEKDMISFMQDASEYADYNLRLTEKMLPWLREDMHICDAGSGLGYLSLALAPHVRQVTAVEINADASSVLSRNCQTRGIANVVSLRCHGILFLWQTVGYSEACQRAVPGRCFRVHPEL